MANAKLKNSRELSTPGWTRPATLTRRGWALVAAVVLAVNLPVLHFFVFRGHPEASVTLPYADDFTDSSTLTSHYFTTGGGLWRVVDGELFSPGVKNNPLWLKAKLPRNVRIEFDTRAASNDGDIRVELFGNGVDHMSGYMVVFGGWGNSRSALVRSNGTGNNEESGQALPTLAQLQSQLTAQVPGATANERLVNAGLFRKNTAMRVETAEVRVEPGRAYHFTVERRGSKLRWRVDGRDLLELDDPFPYEGADHDRFGFSSAEGDVVYDNLKIEPLDDSGFTASAQQEPAAPVLPPAGPFQDDFDGASLSASWHATAPSAVHLTGGSLLLERAENHPVWLRQPLPDPVSIDFDCWTDSTDGDIKVELFGDGTSYHMGDVGAAYVASGYVLVMGGWHNTASIIARQEEHAESRTVREDFRVEPGRHYHWHITRKGNVLTWEVDGQRFLELKDPQPLGGVGHQFFAFSGWDSPVHFARLRIAAL